MHAAGHAMIPPLNNLPTQGHRALREFSSGHDDVPSLIYQAYRTQANLTSPRPSSMAENRRNSPPRH
jgi:hypothetical protein